MIDGGGLMHDPDSESSSAKSASGINSCFLLIAVLMIVVPCILIGGYLTVGPMDGDGQKDMALLQARAITSACEGYKLKHNGKFPEKLKDLLQKDEFGGPYLEGEDSLIDPWGSPYQYDRNGLKYKGERPDIWTVAPDGTEIGNWPKRR
jgi:hypothetical protein